MEKHPRTAAGVATRMEHVGECDLARGKEGTHGEGCVPPVAPHTVMTIIINPMDTVLKPTLVQHYCIRRDQYSKDSATAKTTNHSACTQLWAYRQLGNGHVVQTLAHTGGTRLFTRTPATHACDSTRCQTL